MNPRQHSCIKPKDIAGYGIVEVTAFVVAGRRRCVFESEGPMKDCKYIVERPLSVI